MKVNRGESGVAHLNKKQLLEDVDIQEVVSLHRANERRIVLISGCFDVIHEGHVDVLTDAKAFGDVLIVALHTDESVRKIRGKNFPITPLLERVKIVKALTCVDYVTSFYGDSPLEMIRAIKPDIYVKGTRISCENLEDTLAVEEYGGELRFLPFQVKHLIPEMTRQGQNPSSWAISPLMHSYSYL